MSSPAVRAATFSDAAAINRIYNHYINNTTITLDLEPWNMQRRETWLEQFNHSNARDDPRHALVAELNGNVTGFACNGEFRPKPGYRFSTEITVYIDPQTPSCGIGAALYDALFQQLSHTKLHRALAAISLPNPRSIDFHLRFGFTQVGTLRQVGHKFGRYIDVAWFEKALQ